MREVGLKMACSSGSCFAGTTRSPHQHSRWWKRSLASCPPGPRGNVRPGIFLVVLFVNILQYMRWAGSFRWVRMLPVVVRVIRALAPRRYARRCGTEGVALVDERRVVWEGSLPSISVVWTSKA